MHSMRAVLIAALLLGACAGAQPGTTPTGVPTSPAPPTATPGDTVPASPAEPTSATSAPSGTPAPSGSGSAQPSPSTTTSPGPDAYAWTELSIPDGPDAREDHTFTLAGDGSAAYLFGGRSGNRTFDDIWRYDLATDTWQQLSPEGDVPAGRFGHVAVWKEGVGLVIWSGQADATTFFGDIWAFDPDGVAWRRLGDGGDVPLARYGSCGAIGPDGRLWISHGFTDDEGRFFDTRAYDFTTETWTDETPDGDVPVLRCLHDCLWSPDGRLVLYAGQTTDVPAIGDLWRYQPEPGVWTQEPDPAAPARQLYALAELNGRAFIFGGGGRDGRPLGDLWLLDLTTLEMVEAQAPGPAPSARSGATLVADPTRGRLLLFGGKGRDGELGDTWQLTAPPRP
jgi:hypothetical protein